MHVAPTIVGFGKGQMYTALPVHAERVSNLTVVSRLTLRHQPFKLRRQIADKTNLGNRGVGHAAYKFSWKSEKYIFLIAVQAHATKK